MPLICPSFDIQAGMNQINVYYEWENCNYDLCI